METQRGAVLANELKNNANKLAKWTAAAHISGTDMIKLGYVTRVTPKDNFNHVILGTQVRRLEIVCCGSSLQGLCLSLQLMSDVKAVTTDVQFCQCVVLVTIENKLLLQAI